MPYLIYSVPYHYLCAGTDDSWLKNATSQAPAVDADLADHATMAADALAAFNNATQSEAEANQVAINTGSLRCPCVSL